MVPEVEPGGRFFNVNFQPGWSVFILQNTPLKGTMPNFAIILLVWRVRRVAFLGAITL
jgi:hypothetical protein